MRDRRAISGEMRRLMSQPDEIDRILAAGAEKAREAAAPTLAEVKKIVADAAAFRSLPADVRAKCRPGDTGKTPAPAG